jgi:hypothetical protein
MAKSQKKLNVGADYDGPRAIFDDEEVGGQRGFYALEKDGRTLLKQGGKPVRLMQVDLAEDNPEDGLEKYVVAGKNDPMQTRAGSGNIVELRPDQVRGKTEAGVGG